MSTELLLIAEPLLAAALTRLLADELSELTVAEGPGRLQGAPALVLWRPSAAMAEASLRREALLLRERWQPAPLLVVLGAGHGFGREMLLQLPCQGLIEDPTPERLLEAIATLRGGGRVLQLQPDEGPATGAKPGLGQALLLSGLDQIAVAMAGCNLLLARPSLHPLARLMLEGRLRELSWARRLLLWLWGPLSMAWSDPLPVSAEAAGADQLPGAGGALTLRQRSAGGIWDTVRGRLTTAIETGLANRSGQLLAIEGLNSDRRVDLLIALVHQLDRLRLQLAGELAGGGSGSGAGGGSSDLTALLERWQALQPQLREQALREMASPYVQLPQDGSLTPVAASLVRASDLRADDPELPDALPMVAALVLARPLLVDGQLLPPDDPRAVLHLERLVANWLLRSAELLAAEVLASCGAWPELRRYLLRPDLLSTRNLERLRNQLNAQQRWLSWVERPIALYESRRQLLCLEGTGIASVQLLEPRDRELRQLGGLQQLVTLALETRDAIAPQLRTLLKGIGDLLVVLLTQVVGRAIGLVGRGILQGMGRSLTRP
ncbi:DUF3685 domain-containing protein [Cyanobium sp. CH-040]|nr:DUF3685 domain-containing protein [Cyanobium sp. CH-040]